LGRLREGPARPVAAKIAPISPTKGKRAGFHCFLTPITEPLPQLHRQS
jgi:hypothetical protein